MTQVALDRCLVTFLKTQEFWRFFHVIKLKNGHKITYASKMGAECEVLTTI